MKFLKNQIITGIVIAVLTVLHCNSKSTVEPGDEEVSLPVLLIDGLNNSPTGMPTGVSGDTVVFSIPFDSYSFISFYLKIDVDTAYSFDAAKISATLRISHIFTTPGEKQIIFSGETNEGNTVNDTFTITITGIPVTIIKQPHDTTLSCGATLALALTVTGTPAISYAWYKKNDRSNGDALLSHDSLLLFDSLEQNDSGTYFCIVNNDYGSPDTSKPITITVPGAAPVFIFSIVHSGSDTVCPDIEITLSSSVTDSASNEYGDLSKKTRWRVFDTDTKLRYVLRNSIGQAISFTPQFANSNITVEGTVISGSDTLRDTVQLYITTCVTTGTRFEVHVVDTAKTICPFTEVAIVSTVSDDSTGERTDLSETTRWRVIDLNGQSENALKESVGSMVTFVPDVAYSRVSIEGAVFDGSNTIRDTVQLHIVPGKACKMYIEARPVTATADTLTLRYPQELDRINILDTMTAGDAYAVVRDSSGAFVRLADSLLTEWNVSDDGVSFATATGEPFRTYHGVVTRVADGEGSTYLIAEEQGLPADSTMVICAMYYIARLQLRDKNGVVIDTIRLKTDDTCTFEVWGLKSTMAGQPYNGSSWLPVNATWTFSNVSPVWRIPPPALAHSWVADPFTLGNGTLTLSIPNDTRSESLVVPVIVVRSPPGTTVSIQLITAPPLHAGDTIMVRVEIFNSDGLVPGTYCYGTGGDNPNGAAYSDLPGTGGGKRPVPALIVNGADTLLNVLNTSTFTVNQCFQNGIDTIRLVLYYAPFSVDSLHRIRVELGPDMVAQTEPFILHPASLDSIGIVDRNLNPIPPQILTGSESVTPYSCGYDHYGNYIGIVSTTWTTTGTLDPIEEEYLCTYITADGITQDKTGNLCASAFRSDTTLIRACLPVTIIGSQR